MAKTLGICFGIYLVSLLLIFSTSLLGDYMVGSDIHSEYYIANRMYDGWDINYPHLYNASMSTAVVAPWLSKFLHLDLVWVFKAVYPAFFAFVPVILWFAYRKMMGNWRAVFAVAFFVSVPTFFLELPQLPRQMLAEVFFALMVLAMVSNWRQRYKMACFGVCLPLTILLHWSVGLLSLAFFICLVVALLATKKIRFGLFTDRKLHLGFLSAITVVCLVGGMVWGSLVAGALPMRGVSVATSIVARVLVQETASPTEGVVPWDMFVPPLKGEPLMRAAVGGDFTDVTIWGKVFRVVQYITQILVVVGAVYLLFRYRRYRFSTEFAICVGAAFGLLLCCAVIPSFSYILNLTRFYHITLFFLAPIFVVGVDALCRSGYLAQS